MTIEFVRPEITSDILGYLQSASDYMGNIFPVSRALEQNLTGQGEIWAVCEKDAVLGAFFINFVTNETGRYVNLPLLGGKNMDHWKEALSQFLNQRCRDEKAVAFTLLGRPGWKKAFPELEHAGCVMIKRFSPAL